MKLQTHFSPNIPFIGCNIFSQLNDCLSWCLHLKQVAWGFNIYHLTIGDKIVGTLILHIWNHLPETLKAESSFETFKRSLLSDWLGPNCKCSYLDNLKVLLHSEPNIGFNLSYFRFFLQILYSCRRTFTGHEILFHKDNEFSLL